MKTINRYFTLLFLASSAIMTNSVPYWAEMKQFIFEAGETCMSPGHFYRMAALTGLLAIFLINYDQLRPFMLFAYNCFLKPFLRFGSSSSSAGLKKDHGRHQQLLESFYEGQADIYDITRSRLLRGRETMLRLCAAQLKQAYFKEDTVEQEDHIARPVAVKPDIDGYKTIPTPPISPYLRPISAMTENSVSNKVVWIDIGGGTGWNIERMNTYLPVMNFHAVYLVDITPSLCEIAEKRFNALGWSNVKVICMDALELDLKKLCGDDIEVGLITMSYSLSMIPSFYPIVDKIGQLLGDNGIIGVADFYVSSKYSPEDPFRQHSWLYRWFWQIWFDMDNVYLHPSRREYMEYKFATIKRYSGMNRFIGPFVKIPYYIWIGTKEPQLDSSSSMAPFSLSEDKVQMDLTKVKKSLKLIRNHVHGNSMQWRQPYDVELLKTFSTYIYAFAWEDPIVDLQHLELNSNDEMLVLTSGGCNALEYAIHGPKAIHCVDMNPCQGHMIELKLAGITSLEYADFWKLFGEGHHPAFNVLLDTYLSPYLSTNAYQFWRDNSGFSNLYETGGSGLAIRAFNLLIYITGMQSAVRRLYSAKTLEAQQSVWYEEVRPHFMSRKWVGLLSNQSFAWKALGVPQKQMEMLLNDGTFYEYVEDSMDPLIHKHLLSDNLYFYALCLRKHYVGNAKNQCPSYLTPEGFQLLQEGKNLKAIKIHTAPIVKVLEQEIEPQTLTKMILMDHLDWFDGEQAHDEILAISKSIKQGGMVFWRSSAKRPWYVDVFSKYGFNVRPVSVRMSEKNMGDFRWKKLFAEYTNDGKDLGIFSDCIDRVNMYASFWVAVKN